MILKDIILLTKQTKASADPLNHTVTYSEKPYFSAKVTELNGATAQNNSIGAQYEHTYVIRLQGIHQADKVAFANECNSFNKRSYEIIQIRHHHFKTDIYVGITKVSS
ncbi:hypothetical protein M5C72_02750 [Companilactobacillus allii]|uniref:Phage head-tail adapter protein n=1 Tax=Companilactobacillus allii TaxID=1847728 RepID=A0A1P8Q2M1_9LACO|nr:hypothetical protein [Companilactobacillus allii]APX72081.1 hypothetical protein BTM29_05665 [Companilactobacillus allii]USQ69174.1 hypothetical protein M5C72_02750 [Companilactobacillus allii]